MTYKNNNLHAVSVLGKAFVLLYHLHLKFLSFHIHLTDDLGLDLQVAYGFIVGNDHKQHFLTLFLNVFLTVTAMVLIYNLTTDTYR